MPETPSPINLFFSYSHKDEPLRDELSNHLSALNRQGVINEWHDRLIQPGEKWAEEIARGIEQARIVLLLVSSDFLASEYCYDVELKAALERHGKGEAVVIPIILRSCSWRGEAFGELQALPKNAKAVTLWDNQDEAFTNIAEGIRAAALNLRAKIETAPDPKPDFAHPDPQPDLAPFAPAMFSQPEPSPSHRARLDLEEFGEELLRREVAEFKVANPYLLGDTFVGRETELADLGEWLRADEDRMLCICDLGGTGKSALVWRWLNDKATRETLEQGRIKQYWCSFYARSFDSVRFLHELADQFGGATIVEASPWRAQERLRRFVLDRLKTERWLLVLDGLEREMGAFVNPEHFQVDSEEQDRRNEAKQVPVEEKYIRSPVFAQFLRELLETGTKVLITTRIFPENLNAHDRPLPGVREYLFLPMPEADAVRVWNASGEADDSPLQREFFESVRCHPQVVSVVAAAVKEERTLRFTEWFEDFDETERHGCLDAEAPLTARRHCWLELAVRDLIGKRRDEWLTLCYIVRRSEASSVESLMKSLVDAPDADRRQAGRFRSGDKLIEVLKYLAMRRLIGVDFKRGLVDVHPVIRGLVMDYILKQYQAGASGDVEVMRHLESGEDSRDLLLRFLNQPDLEQQFASLSNVLDQFRGIPAGPQAALGILAKFYPDAAAADGRPWQSALPALRLRKDQAWVMRRTAHELMTRGRWEESGALIRRAEIAFQLCGDLQSVEDCRHSHDWQALYGGTLRQAEAHQLDALETAGSERAESAQYWLALLLAIRQSEHAAELLRSLPADTDRWTLQTVAEAWLYLDDDETAAELAGQAWDRRETEHNVMAQALWEAVTIGLARGRMKQSAEAGFYLDYALRHGVGWSYNLVPMFALAGRIELHYQQAMKTGRVRDRQEQFALADGIYKQYCKSDPTDQFQIPASEAHLAMALVERERWNLPEAGALARRALKIARGEAPPFYYASVVRRATNFLTNVLQEPPPPAGPIGWEALEHEDRLRRWMESRQRPMA